jgi:hypothetical protein
MTRAAGFVGEHPEMQDVVARGEARKVSRDRHHGRY